jgi:hypothetical protein
LLLFFGPATLFTTEFKAAVNGLVAEFAEGIVLTELPTAVWMASIGVEIAFITLAEPSDPVNMKMIAEIMVISANPRMTHGVYAANVYCHVLSLYSL